MTPLTDASKSSAPGRPPPTLPTPEPPPKTKPFSASHFLLVLTASFLLCGASPAFLAVQQAAVGADLSLQLHLGVEQLAVALPLGGQSTPHLLQLALQPADHLGQVVQLAGVELLRALQGVLQAFLLRGRSQLSVSGATNSAKQQSSTVLTMVKPSLVELSCGMYSTTTNAIKALMTLVAAI